MFDRIDAALYHPSRHAAYFFRGSEYIKFISSEGVRTLGGSKIRRIGVDGWQRDSDDPVDPTVNPVQGVNGTDGKRCLAVRRFRSLTHGRANFVSPLIDSTGALHTA